MFNLNNTNVKKNIKFISKPSKLGGSGSLGFLIRKTQFKLKSNKYYQVEICIKEVNE